VSTDWAALQWERGRRTFYIKKGVGGGGTFSSSNEETPSVMAICQKDFLLNKNLQQKANDAPFQLECTQAI